MMERRTLVATSAAAAVAAATPAGSSGATDTKPAVGIDPDSGNRLPLVQRDALPEAAQAIYDQVVDPNGVTLRGLRGPSGIYLHSPSLAGLLRPLNNYLRNGSGLSGRVREVAILSAARVADNQFEWTSHLDEAQKQGVPAATVEAIKTNLSTDTLDPADALIIEVCRASFVNRHVPPALYDRALGHFGEQQLVDLVILMGYYVMMAGLLTAVDMQLDPGVEPSLPVPAPPLQD